MNIAQDSKTAITTPEIMHANKWKIDLHDLSTAESSIKLSNSDDIELVHENDDLEQANKLISFNMNKGSQSKERKLSNEYYGILPPQATSSILRPSKQSYGPTIPLEKGKNNQQALKPMTILGFLEKSCSDFVLEVPGKKGIEKADTSLHKLSLISGTTSKVGTKVPALTHD